MRNSFELLTSESQYNIADLQRVIGQVTKTYKMARDILPISSSECPMVQIQLGAAFWYLVSCDIDPCCENMSDITGIPNSSIHRWMANRARAGLIKIVPDGHRKLFVTDRPARREMVQVFDKMVFNCKSTP